MIWQVFRRLYWACAGLVFLCAPSIADDTPVVLYDFGGVNLHDSRWGQIVTFQSALNDALGNCGKNGHEPDGWFGNDTHRALRRLATCDGYAGLQIGEGQQYDGAVTDQLWRKLGLSDLPSA